MSVLALAALTAIAFVALLLVGHNQIARGSNKQTANGAVALTLATILGAMFLAALLSS